MKRTQKLLIIGRWKENQEILSLQLDSASPVNFLNGNVLHEMKLRNLYLKNNLVDKATKDSPCGFRDNVSNITCKLFFFPILSNGWSHEDCHLFLTQGHEEKILGNDHLSKVRIDFSGHFQTNKMCKSKKFTSTAEKDKEIIHISKTFKKLVHQIGKVTNQMKIAHFYEFLKPIQLKSRRVPLHLLDSVETELSRLRSEGHIEKLEN